MIRQFIHNVHRFIPFTLPLFCAIALFILSPLLANAATLTDQPLLPSHGLNQTDSTGHLWDTWGANGSNVIDWTQDEVGGYLHYTFVIHDYTGGFYCSGSCRQITITNADPLLTTPTGHMIYTAGIGAPENNSNGHYYDVDIQFNATGYHESVYDETAGSEDSDTDYTFDTSNPYWVFFNEKAYNSQYPSPNIYGSISQPDDADHAAGGGVQYGGDGTYGGNDVWNVSSDTSGGTGGGGDDVPPPDCAGGKSCIWSVKPANLTTIATSTSPSVGGTGTIIPSDFKDGARLQVKVDRDTDSQAVSPLLAVNSAFGNTTTFPIVVSGDYNVSTTSIVNTLGINRVGRYHMTQTLQSPGLGIHFWFIDWDISYNTLDSTTTTFIVGTTTSIDKIQDGSGTVLSGLANDTGDLLAGCQFNWFSSAVDFSLGSQLMTCMGGIAEYFFLPSGQDIQANVAELQSNVLNRWPWGYATRMVTIMTDASSTADIPTVVAPIYLTGTSTPDTTITFNTQDMLDGGAALAESIKANGTNQDIEDITKPWIQLFLALSIVVIIFHDLMGMAHHTKHNGGQSPSGKRN